MSGIPPLKKDNQTLDTNPYTYDTPISNFRGKRSHFEALQNLQNIQRFWDYHYNNAEPKSLIAPHEIFSFFQTTNWYTGQSLDQFWSLTGYLTVHNIKVCRSKKRMYLTSPCTDESRNFHRLQSNPCTNVDQCNETTKTSLAHPSDSSPSPHSDDTQSSPSSFSAIATPDIRVSATTHPGPSNTNLKHQ